MYLKFLLLSLVVFTLFLQSDSSEDCNKKYSFGFGNFACGKGCTGTPSCGKKTCGNVANMCYCSCADNAGDCYTSELGYKWNGGIKLANGSYALNGTKGDGKYYVCGTTPNPV
jgi:hypothetical protein